MKCILAAVDFSAVTDRVADTAARLARALGVRLDAKMVVMGSHGHGALRRLLVGGITMGILRRAARPVLVVPSRAGE